MRGLTKTLLRNSKSNLEKTEKIAENNIDNTGVQCYNVIKPKEEMT